MKENTILKRKRPRVKSLEVVASSNRRRLINSKPLFVPYYGPQSLFEIINIQTPT